jgi:N-acetylneuraminate lyase
MKLNLGGILPAVITPLYSDETVNTRALEQLLERVYSAGAAGVYLCGSTGEGLALAASERKRVAEAGLRSSPPGKHVIVHVGARSEEDVSTLATHAARIGVTAISSLPPVGVPAAGLEGYYRSLAARSDVPVVAYYFPEFTGFSLKFDQLLQIGSLPGVHGIKFTDYDLYALSRLVEHGVTVFNGRDEILAAGLLMGAHGGIGSIYNLLTRQFVQLFDLASAARWREARELQKEINRVIDVLLQYPLIPAIKKILFWSGIDCGLAVRSTRPLAPEEEARLRTQFDSFQEMLAA